MSLERVREPALSYLTMMSFIPSGGTKVSWCFQYRACSNLLEISLYPEVDQSSVKLVIPGAWSIIDRYDPSDWLEVADIWKLSARHCRVYHRGEERQSGSF